MDTSAVTPIRRDKVRLPSAVRRLQGAQRLRVVLMGAAAFGLSACEEDPEVAAQAYPDLAACLAADDAVTDPADCEAAYAEALQANAASAPRYDERALCEDEHGGACVEEVRSNGTHVFLPVMAGFLIGRALGGGGASRTVSSPLYGVRGGGYATPSGGARVATTAGSSTLRASSFQPAPATVTQAPMSRATVASRGGFGTARASGSGFGG